MDIIQRSARGFFWNQIGKILGFVLGFGFSIVVARGLGPERYGVYAIIMSFCGLAILFSSFGLENTMNTYVPKLYGEDNKGKLAYFLKKFLLVRLLLVAIIGGIMYLFSPQLSLLMKNLTLSKYIRLAMLYIVFSSISSFFMSVAMGQLKTKLISVIKVGMMILNITFVYILLKMDCGVTAIIWILAFTSLFSLLGYLFNLRKDMFYKSTAFDTRRMYKFSGTSWLTNCADYALGKQTDILLMGYFLIKATEIGYYNIAFGLTTLVKTLFIAGLAGVTLASFSEIAAKRDRKTLGQAWKLNIEVSVLLDIPILMFCIYYAKPIIIGFYSDAYLPSVILFRTFAFFSIIGRSLGGGAHTTVLYAIGKERLNFYLRLICGILNLILDVILIVKYGALGAIIATGISTVTTVALEIIVVKRYIISDYPVKLLAKLIGISIVALFICSFIPVTNVLSLVGIGCVYMGVIGAMFFLIKPLTDQHVTIGEKINQRLGVFVAKFAR